MQVSKLSGESQLERVWGVCEMGNGLDSVGSAEKEPVVALDFARKSPLAGNK